MKRNSFFLIGPRGVGKTSWLKHEFKDVIWIDLLNDKLYRQLLARPESLAELIANDSSKTVVIDEIQRVPALLNEIHRQIESHSRIFIMTGSSVRKLKREKANLLAGRAIVIEMNPFGTALELEGSFDLKKALRRGLLPKAYLSESIHFNHNRSSC